MPSASNWSACSPPVRPPSGPAALLSRRVPAGQVNDRGADLAFAERICLEPTVAIPSEDGSTVTLTCNPIRPSATLATYPSAPPGLAED